MKKNRSLSWRIMHKIIMFLSPVMMIKFYLNISDLFLSVSNLLITKKNHGIHPKHEIMKYEEFFLEYINVNDTVLDIGSGNGYLTKKISKKCFHITGVEINKGSSQFACLNNSNVNITYLNKDINEIKEMHKFDIVVMSNVLEHIEDRIRLLNHVRSLASRLLVRVPAIDRDWWPLWRRDNGLEWRNDETHYIEYLEDELLNELHVSGWRVLSLKRKWGEFYVYSIANDAGNI